MAALNHLTPSNDSNHLKSFHKNLLNPLILIEIAHKNCYTDGFKESDS